MTRPSRALLPATDVGSEWSAPALRAALPDIHCVSSLQAVTRRAKVAPARKMSKFLKHFTVVGDDYHSWNVNYKKWENEEDEEEEEQLPSTPASGEEGRAADPTAAPASRLRRPLDFRAMLRKLFSSHRFQVGGQRPEMPRVGQSPQLRVRRPGWGGPSLPLVHSLCRCSPSTAMCPQAPIQCWVHGQTPCCQGLN